VRLKKALPYVLVYILAVVAIPLFFNEGWFRPFPYAEYYAGELMFSGDEAFADLRTLVEEYPNRSIGTRADRLSAQWVQRRLQETGLDARLEEFTCLVREPSVQHDRVLSVPALSLTYSATGYNVVAISPGKTAEAVIIGAHRDVSGNIQGAEDDGSGTASVIELARILSGDDHYYTYMFVSYDGEEAGLRGSEAFARSHRDVPVKLAISLDMTGWDRATTVGFYPFVSSRSASPLWTVALARNLAVSKGLHLFYFGARDGGSEIAPVTFWRARAERLTGRVPTDTGPFVDRGIPSLGLVAIQMGPYGQGQYAPIHGPVDTIDQVSAEVMERTGRFAEQYVRSLELNSFTGAMNSRFYLVSGDRVLDPHALEGFALYSCVLAIAIAVLSWRDAAAARAFGGFLRSELLWICPTLGLALASAGFPVLVRSPLGNSLTLGWFNAVWGVVTLGGTVALVYLRGRHLGKQDVSYHEVTAWQKLLLNLVYAGVFVALTALRNPFVALAAALFPITILGRVSFRAEDGRVFFSVATAAWSVISVIGMRGRMSAAAFNPVTGLTVLTNFIAISAWMMTAVYVLAVPRRGLRSDNHAAP
jgi:hypothetical protein